MKIFKLVAVTAIILFLAVKIHDRLSAANVIREDTITHHLATNAAARTRGLAGGYSSELEFQSPYATNADQLIRLTNATWTPTFWLKNVAGLPATPIGYREIISGQGLPTMISPRHYLCATHMHPEGYTLAFLDVNNVVHWRKTMQRTDVTNDIAVGILDQDLPLSVGFLPVLPANFTNYFPLTNSFTVQGIGMNQDFCLFGEPMNFANWPHVLWNSGATVPDGLGTNWNVTIRGGDSSNPAMILVGNQLVLVAHNFFVNGGPNYAYHIPAINEAMHRLSEKNHVSSDYQLTEFSLTNWPVVR